MSFWPRLIIAALIGGITVPASQNTGRTPRFGYRIVNAYPHDREAFTQGLIFKDGFLYESTGLNGNSSLRKVRVTTGQVVQKQDLAWQYFAEGLADWNDRLLQLTWKSNIGFVYDRATLKQIGKWDYLGEGWGLTRDDTRLIMSDGSSDLRFINPATLRETGRMRVTDAGRPVPNLNELEFVRGEVFANIWQTDTIARIDPATGVVKSWIDLAGLLPAADRNSKTDVLNGIAYDSAGDRLFVTGKLWPKLFEIKLVPR